MHKNIPSAWLLYSQRGADGYPGTFAAENRIKKFFTELLVMPVLPGCAYGHMPATPVHQGQTLNGFQFRCSAARCWIRWQDSLLLFITSSCFILDGSAGLP